MAAPRTFDIFCRVVDNFGDAGVCWRLAQQLAAEHGVGVRLWIDDLTPLRSLQPAAAAVERQSVEGVEVRRWSEAFTESALPDVVIEAFGCGLPDVYVASMASSSRAPLWIVLEYLSAEDWVPTHHGLPSPHPRASLPRYYFFPGFARGTGGLLREANLFSRRDGFGAAQRAAFWRSVGHEPVPSGTTAVSLFAYESAPLDELFAAWLAGDMAIVAAVPEGRLLSAAARFFGGRGIAPPSVLRRGRLELRAMRFLPQARYDELLWACDVNFVRGEDSFVRAQWAAKAFVWHIYPQALQAHGRKLEAFLALYGEGMPEGARRAASDFMRLWNQIDVPAVTMAAAWREFVQSLGALREHGAQWARRLAETGELAGNLVEFCRQRLESG